MRTKVIASFTAALLVVVLAVAVLPAGAAQAQDQPDPEVPSQDIIPKPNEGQAPEEAGDRGGALQLSVALLVFAAIGGGVWHVSRSARRQSTRASQDSMPSMKPER